MWKKSAFTVFSLCTVTASAAGVSTGSVHAAAPSAQESSRPNVVVILADDLGYSDTSLYGGTINTPNISQIAAGGVTFTNGHVASPVCAPSRFGLLSGRDPARSDANSLLTTRGAPADMTGTEPPGPSMAQVLQHQGYDTAAIGKWDVSGVDPAATTAQIQTQPNLPHDAGFDQYYGMLAGIGNYCPQDDNDIVQYESGSNTYVKRQPTEYITDDFTDRAASYIRDHSGGNRPFFLYLAPNAPHVAMNRPPGTGQDPGYQSPQTCPDTAPNTDRTTFEQVVHNLDDGIGEVMAALDTSKAAKNTIVVFLSDNGPVHAGIAGPLRGEKFTDFEGGVRVPFVMRWPGHVPAGAQYTRPVSSLDLLPTFADAAGATAVSARGHYPGADLARILDDRDLTQPRLEWRYYNDDAGPGGVPVGTARLGILDRKIKYIRDVMPNGTSNQYLFDFSRDYDGDGRPDGQNERVNEIGNPAYHDALARMKAEYLQWDQRNPLRENFTIHRPKTGLPDGWASSGSDCTTTTGILQCQTPSQDASAIAAGTDFANVSATTDIQFESSGQAGLLLADASDQDLYPLNGYKISLINGTNALQISSVRDGQDSTVAKTSYPVVATKTYHLSADVRDRTIRVSVNGQTALVGQIPAPLTGESVGLQASHTTVLFDNLHARRNP